MEKTIKFLLVLVIILTSMSCSKGDDLGGKETQPPVNHENHENQGNQDNPDTPDPPSSGDSKHSPEAARLLDYLKSIYGKKTLSGTCTNVNWNTNEAQWVYKHTGKWPAINNFDFIHLPFSTPGGWIDYSNTKVVEDWHNAGGIVSIMWHWNMPANDGSGWSFYYGTAPDKTSFDIRKINDENSPEYKRMIKDIDQVGACLKALQAKGIPVIWRPLHEAGGRWFWWGMDAAACRKLWQIMYKRFADAGINNLIWVFTPAAAWKEPYSKGFDYYPGDEYVDIVGMDVYNQSDAGDCYRLDYKFLTDQKPSKMAALTECGNVATISSQWNAGAKWLYFMPWYDYERTNDPSSAAFNEESHSNASVSWWKDAFSCDFVLSRDDVKY